MLVCTSFHDCDFCLPAKLLRYYLEGPYQANCFLTSSQSRHRVSNQLILLCKKSAWARMNYSRRLLNAWLLRLSPSSFLA